MSKSSIKILKQCLNCGQMFEAQKVTTKYCSHKCNCQHYKLRARLANIDENQTDTSTLIKQKVRPVIKSIDLALIKDKEFLKVKEVAALLGCNIKTVYHIINSGLLPSSNISGKLTLIKREDIDKLFEPWE